MSATTDLFDPQAKRRLVQFDTASSPGSPVPAHAWATRLVRVGLPLQDQGTRFRNIDVLVLGELLHDTSDISVAEVLQDLPDKTNIAVRQGARDDIKLLEAGTWIFHARRM